MGIAEDKYGGDALLELSLRKGGGKEDDDGNFVFEVEASNENVDFDDQVVLQDALMESRDNFLKNGIISYDHLYKMKDGATMSRSEYIIGEPVDVYKDGSRTIVRGKLYKNNALARDIIAKLKDGCTRIRASIGGVFPKIIHDANTGVETITKMIWNELALTPMPVNNTVGCARLAKSLSPREFCERLAASKAMVAGGCSDSARMAGGRALVPEDVEGRMANAKGRAAREDERRAADFDWSAIDDLLRLMSEGKVEGGDGARLYLMARGFDAESADETVKELASQACEIEINKGGGSKMGAEFAEKMSGILKSLKGGKKKDEGKIDGAKPGETKDAEDKAVKPKAGEGDDVDLVEGEGDVDIDDVDEDEDDVNLDDVGEGKGGGGDVKKQKKAEKSLSGRVDATDVLKSLAESVAAIDKRLSTLERAAPVKKSLGPVSVTRAGEDAAARGVPEGRPSEEDFDKCKDILVKSFQAGEISLLEQARMESEVQKSMRAGAAMSRATYEFFARKIGKQA